MSGLNEALQIHGKLSIVKTDKDGNTTTTEVPNLVVATGKTVIAARLAGNTACLLYTSPSPRDRQKSRMPSSA